MHGSGLSRDPLGGTLHGLHDVMVASAAAEIALEAGTNLLLGWVRVASKEIVGGHDHARGAEAALQPVLDRKALLEWMQPPVLREPFDRENVGAVSLNGEYGTRFHSDAIQHDGARTALAGVAPNVRAGEGECVSEVVDEKRAWLYVAAMRRAVDGYADLRHTRHSKGVDCANMERVSEADK
jgi:hypothetical protein